MLKNSKRLCVFAHFNPQFRVAEYVFYYLQRLHDDVNADIIFSSTSAIPTADRARLEALCLYIVIRKTKDMISDPGRMDYMPYLMSNS